jgi:hypothetical protein
MLKGEAKTEYMREYMRRKRAGLPTATKPKPKEWEPTQRIVDEIAHWAKYPWRRRSAIAGRVLKDLTLDNDESWMEACRRYKTLTAERKQERQAEREREKQRAEERKILHCSFCGETMTETGKPRWLGTGYEFSDGTKVYDAIICKPCVTKFAKMLKRKKQNKRSKHADSMA